MEKKLTSTTFKKRLAAFTLAAVSSVLCLTAPAADTHTFFEGYSITASASSNNYTADTQVLSAGQSVVADYKESKDWYSKDGRFKLVMQKDGNLVIYDTAKNNNVVWASGTSMGANNGTDEFKLVMQKDGNLVIYDQKTSGSKSRTPKWSTQTENEEGNYYSLRLSNQGELYVYHSGRKQSLWSSRNEIGCTSTSNTFMSASQCISSKNRNYRAVMQGDGNFVIYQRKGKSDVAIWSTGTAGNSNAYLVLQQDGNMVIYSSAAKPLFSTKTSTKPYADYKMTLGDDGVLKIIKKNNGSVIWSSTGTSASGATINVNMDLLKQVGRQPVGSVSCSCYALAYARTILDGKVHYFSEYNQYGNSQNNVCALWANGNFGVKTTTNKTAGYQMIYDEIKAGRPVVILVASTNGSRSTQHYVTVVGVSGDRNNLSPSSFTVIDPARYDGSASPTLENMGATSYDLKYSTTDYIGYNIVKQN